MKMVAFLRAVNVTGNNMVSMASLADLFRNLGFTEVQTYKQSGNVIFSGSAAEEKIEKALAKKLGLHLMVIVKTAKEMETIVMRNPFNIHPAEDQFFHTTLFKQKIPIKRIAEADQRKADNEEYVIDGSVIYLSCPNGYGKTKLNNTNLERWTNMSATTRNWRTIQAINNLLGE